MNNGTSHGDRCQRCPLNIPNTGECFYWGRFSSHWLLALT
jgi:hypothetical protein